MQALAAVFMDILGKKTGQEDRAAAIIRESVSAEFSERTRELLSSETLFFSDEGHALHQDLLVLKRDIEKLLHAKDAAKLGAKLKTLYVRAEELHRETQREIEKNGRIRAAKLHFFYADEKEKALDILEQYVRVELFRVLVFGGGSLFSRCKPLKGYQHTLQDRMKYLVYELAPVTDSQSFKLLAKTRYWAVVHQDEMRAGPMGRLPGMLITDPVKTDHRFLPGEHGLLPGRGGLVLQGIGHLTNMTPENIDKAQLRNNLQTVVTPEMLKPFVDYLSDPDSVLNHIFSGKPYVISTEQYFAAASCAEACITISNRRRLGKCLLCGQSAESGLLCERCGRRIRIV